MSRGRSNEKNTSGVVFISFFKIVMVLQCFENCAQCQEGCETLFGYKLNFLTVCMENIYSERMYVLFVEW